MTARTSTKGHTSKHTTTKHKATAKHHATKTKKSTAVKGTAAVHTVGTHAKAAKARGYAIGDLLPVCAAEAVAMSLRLAGQPVHADELAWLWEEHGELSIPDAAALLGVTVRPAVLPAPAVILGINVPGPHAVLATPDGWWSWGELLAPWPATVEEAWEVILP